MKTENPYKNSDTNKRYYTYDYFLKKKFGKKCAKIPINAGFTCPNIDGTKGYGGCIYCSSKGSGDFSENSLIPIEEQFEIMKNKMKNKWSDTYFIPYFQAHTNTYAPLEVLREKFERALKLPGVVGLNIATRADALEDNVVEYLKELSKRTYLTVELGLQSCHDKTALLINRGHTYEEFLKGYEKLNGINRCIHIINGLPYETKEDMLDTARTIAALNPQSVKIHMLYVLKGTRLCELYEKENFHILTKEEYIDVVASQLEILPYDTVIGRITGDADAELLVEPQWTKKKFVVMNDLDKEFVRRGTYQGFCSKFI